VAVCALLGLHRKDFIVLMAHVDTHSSRRSAPSSRPSQPLVCAKCKGTGARGIFGRRHGFGIVRRRCRHCGGTGRSQLAGSASSDSESEPESWAQNFDVVRCLGKGSFGKVFQVRGRKALPGIEIGQDYAMKLLSKQRYGEQQLEKYVYAERNVLRTGDHPFLVSLVYAFSTFEYWVLIMEYACGGSLADKLSLQPEENPGFDEDLARRYASELLLALDHLHSTSVIFRDLKPDNVVLSSLNQCMLTDFGLVKENFDVATGATSVVGSVGYAAPEIIRARGNSAAAVSYDNTVDWYSLGVCLFVMLSGGDRLATTEGKVRNRPPRNHGLLMARIRACSSSADALAAVQQMTDADPTRRGTAGSIRQLPFFGRISWDELLPQDWKEAKPRLGRTDFAEERRVAVL